MKRLADKVAIVTGGSNGIGKVIVTTFLAEGAKVVFWDLDEEKAKALLDAQGLPEESLMFMQVNTADQAAVQAATQAVKDKFGRIDILINNAGITRDASFLKMTAEQWQQVIDVNLTGVFYCTQAVAKVMVEQGGGKVVNASSTVGLQGNFGQTNYVATKAGVIGMTKVWAKELGRKGINVNAVAPGFTLTEMVQAIPEKVKDMVKGKTPLGRMATPEDIAKAYVFLASDEASFVHGETLVVDGAISL